MKILSKFKDFYDHQAYIYGVDDKITYDRKNFGTEVREKLENGLYYLRIKDLDFVIDNFKSPGIAIKYTKTNDWDRALKLLCVAGRYFPLLVLDNKRMVYNPQKHKESVKVYVDRYESFWGKRPRLADDWYNDQDENVVKASKVIKAPVFILDYHEKRDRDSRYTTVFIENEVPNLGALGLAALYPADQLYQDISYFITNQINESPDLQPAGKPPQTDKEKVVGHGFDLRQSFRHRKNDD